MSYSCTDFVDSIMSALGVQVPLESLDSPLDQASICLDEIKRLQDFEKTTIADIDKRIKARLSWARDKE